MQDKVCRMCEKRYRKKDGYVMPPLHQLMSKRGLKYSRFCSRRCWLFYNFLYMRAEGRQ